MPDGESKEFVLPPDTPDAKANVSGPDMVDPLALQAGFFRARIAGVQLDVYDKTQQPIYVARRTPTMPSFYIV